jgi:hypothetical protein
VASKLEQLCELEGFDSPTELAEAFICDSLCPCICMNPDCDMTDSLEPDQDRGYCDACGTNSMKSAFVLMGII